MKRSRFSEEQIIGVLKEQEAGMPTVEVCRRHGVSPATFYKWKSKFGGMEVSEVTCTPTCYHSEVESFHCLTLSRICIQPE
jgi:transposase-like protein